MEGRWRTITSRKKTQNNSQQESVPKPSGPDLAELAQTCIAACGDKPTVPGLWYCRGRLREFVLDYANASEDYLSCLQRASADDILSVKTRWRLGIARQRLNEIGEATRLHTTNLQKGELGTQLGVQGLARLGQHFWSTGMRFKNGNCPEKAVQHFEQSVRHFQAAADAGPHDELTGNCALWAAEALMLQADVVVGAPGRQLFRRAADRLGTVASTWHDEKTAPEATYWQGDCRMKAGDQTKAQQVWAKLVAA